MQLHAIEKGLVFTTDHFELQLVIIEFLGGNGQHAIIDNYNYSFAVAYAPSHAMHIGTLP
ncbi:MAG: hypothetical protein MJE68_19155 [Proteobacteria bacterium]|nr:hypothetical protein [Pseudomonadota bacterium]